MNSSFAKSNLIYIGLALFFHLLVALPFFGIWFLLDDFICMYGSMQNPLKLLFSRETYALFNRWFFTPLLPLSFKLDWHLFRLNPFGYHIHNYLIILINSLILYKIARFYLPGFYSLLSSIFFLFSIPAFVNIGALSWRHYIWGCLFTLLSFYLYKRFEQTNIGKFLISSIMCYFVAILFKSAFATLPLAVFLLSKLRPSKRIKILGIYMCVFLFYLIWRIHILGGIGGYFFIPSPTVSGSIFTILFKIPYTISKTIWGVPFFIYLIPIALFIVRKRLGIAIFFLVLISISPFIFTRADESYIFAAKFILTSAIVALALALLTYYLIKVREGLKNYICLLMCILILTLQMINLPRAFSELNLLSQSIKSTCSILSSQKIKVIYDPYVWIYNYFYLVKGRPYKRRSKLIGIGALDKGDLPLDLYLYQKYVGCLSNADAILIPSKGEILKYMSLKRAINEKGKEQTLEAPKIILNCKSNLLKAKILDKASMGSLRLYLLSQLGEGNIMFYSVPINKKSFSFPIRKGEVLFFFFVSCDGRFSKPLIFRN